jgi:hypothetical protein
MVPPVTTVDNDHDSQHLARMCFRSPRPGPEAQLVQQFLGEARLRAFPDCRITVFKELKLDGAYPDIVLVATPCGTCHSSDSNERVVGDIAILQQQSFGDRANSRGFIDFASFAHV